MIATRSVLDLRTKNLARALRWLDKCLTKMGREEEAKSWREEAERITYPPAIRRLPKPLMLAQVFSPNASKRPAGSRPA